MANWEQSLQLSIIGGAIVFAYIASTFPQGDKDNQFMGNLKLFFYLIAIALVLGAVGTNYAIIDSTDSTLLQNATGTTMPLGSALNGIFFTLIAVVSVVFLVMIIVVFKNAVDNYNLKKKKKEEGMGDED